LATEKSIAKTDDFWAIVDANNAPEELELFDAIERLDFPDALTIHKCIMAAPKGRPFCLGRWAIQPARDKSGSEGGLFYF
jgi:aminoglycoside phosphotransferase (APT) family kinase protein